MIQRFSTLTMESMVVCKIDEPAQSVYDTIGIKPWHHIVIVNDYAFVYIWDTRIIEHVMPASCLRQEDLTYAVIDNRMDLIVNDETPDTIRKVCEDNKYDLPVLFCKEPMTDDERALLDPMHY